MDFSFKTTLAVASALILAFPLQAATVEGISDPGTESPTATQNKLVLHGDQLIATGQSQLAMALARLMPNMLVPQFSSNDGSDHVQTLIVNGMAPDHVVVLVNGKRRHASALLNLADAVGRGSKGPDLTMIPLGMVDRVEVTQGSGAGRHGSGAVAAVINVVLKESPSDASLYVQYGLNSGELTGVPELGGRSVANDTVTLISAGDRNVDDGDGDTFWLAGDWGFEIGDGGFMHLGGEWRDQARTSREGFDAREQYPRLGDGSLDFREGTVDRLNHHYGQGDVEQWNAVMNLSVPMSDRLELYSVVTIGSLLTTTAADFRRPVDERNIPEIYPDGYLPRIHSNIDDRGYRLGVRGAHFGWDWDLSINMGENEIDWTLRDSLNASMGTLSPTTFSTGNQESREQTIAIEASRNFDWGVPARLALGVESLTEEFEVERGEPASYVDGGALTASGAPREVGSQGFSGFKTAELEEDRDVLGFFAQLDADLSERARVSAAARYDDYSDVGGVISAQLSGGFDLSERLGLRASVATGVHVQELAQAFFAKTVTVFDPLGTPRESGFFAAGSDAARALGGDDLREEEFLSIEAGLHARPLPVLNLSLDVYRIELDDRVARSETFSGTDVIGLLESSGVSGVASVSYHLNAVATRTQGVNLNASYDLETGYGALRFTLAANVNDTKITAVPDDPANLTALGLTRFSDTAQVRLEDGTPDSKLILLVDWQREKMNTWLRATRHGKVTDASADFDLDAQLVLDFALAYQATPRVKVTFGANNLLDEYPDSFDVSPGSPVFNIYPYSRYSAFGTNGRFLYLRMNAEFE